MRCIVRHCGGTWHGAESGSISKDALMRITQRPILLHPDEPPTLEEVQRAIQLLKSSKDPGADGIPAEVLQSGGDAMTIALHDLYTKMWNSDSLPQDLMQLSLLSTKTK